MSSRDLPDLPADDHQDHQDRQPRRVVALLTDHRATVTHARESDPVLTLIPSFRPDQLVSLLEVREALRQRKERRCRTSASAPGFHQSTTPEARLGVPACEGEKG
jgi:hypothetical protein